MQDILREAGFIGVELSEGVIYARSNAALPEFTATHSGGVWQLAQSWPLHATAVQIADWNARHPHAPLDIYLGETRMTLRIPPESLHNWANLTEEMVAQCTAWRRETRQRDEGM